MPEPMLSDDPADVADMQRTVAESRNWPAACISGCSLPLGHTTDHAYIDPRDAILADILATGKRCEALLKLIVEATSDSGTGIEILARPGGGQ